jgi:uncharacterized phage protein gp47/JayE
MAGLTTTGFEAKPLDEIKSDIEADERALISTKINTSSASLVGQINGIMATKLRQLWELLQALYNAFFADGATGFALTLRAALTGTTRDAATYSRTTCTVNVDMGTYLPGTLVASVLDSPDSRFSNLETITNAGPSAAAITGNVFECLTTGPVRANAGTLTVKAQAVTGWNSITNPADATLGAVEEGDPSLRAKREAELRAQGSTTADAVKADLLRDVEGVERVTVLENDTAETDVNGVPRNSLECIVYGPASPTADDDQAVAEQVWASKAGGIGTYGSTSKTVVDLQGKSHTVRFTRPTDLPAFCEVAINVDGDTYAGELAVQEALAASTDALDSGVALDWRAVVGLPYTVAGVRSVTSFGLALTDAGPFLEQNITPTIRQQVVLSTVNIVVTPTVTT